MGQVLWMIIALAVGAVLGTSLRPGIAEIAIVALTLTVSAYWYRSFSIRKRIKAASHNA